MTQTQEPFFLITGINERIPLSISDEDLHNLLCDRKVETTFEQVRQRRDRVRNSLNLERRRPETFVQNDIPVFFSQSDQV